MTTLAEKLQAALEEYGEHAQGCDRAYRATVEHRAEVSGTCSCGLAQALKLTEVWGVYTFPNGSQVVVIRMPDGEKITSGQAPPEKDPPE